MASPTVRGTPTEGAGASATTHTITFAQNTGDRVVIFLANDATARTWSLGDSFVNLTNASATFHIFTKVLDGSEGGNMVATAGVATKSAWIAYNITTGTHDSATAPVFSTVATGTSTAPNSGSLSPTGGSKDYLWLSAFRQAGEEADDDTWCNSAPSTPGTFTNLYQKSMGTSGAVTLNGQVASGAVTLNGQVASAQYAATTATVDPGAFNTDQSLAWRAYTVAIYPDTTVQKTGTAESGTATDTSTAPTVVRSGTAETGTGSDTASLAVVTAGSYFAEVMSEPGLAGYWRLGEASGNPQDSHGTNHATTVVGAPTYGVTGALLGDSNKAMTFNGTSSYVSVADHASLDFGDTWTLEAWIYRGATGADRAIVSKGATGYYMRVLSAGNLNILKSQTTDMCTSNAIIPTGWHHVAATKSGATVHLYCDGVEMANGGYNPATTADNAHPLTIGAEYSGTAYSEFSNASLDEVAVYNTALSLDRIKAHFEAGYYGNTARTDSGTGAEVGGVSTPPVEKTGTAESGTGADTASLAAAHSRSESGTGADTASLAAARSATAESGTGADTAAVPDRILATVTDTGTATDTSYVTQQKVGTESGAGTDTAAKPGVVRTATAESGVASDTAGLVAALATRSDTGTPENEGSSSPDALIAATDSGTGTEVGTKEEIGSTPKDGAPETGTGTDAASLAAAFTATDAGTGADAASSAPAIAASDSGTGSDAAAVTQYKTGTESGAGTDTASLAAALATRTDAGAGSDTSSPPAAAIAATESGTADDVSSVDKGFTQKTGDDTGAGSDSSTAPAAAITGSESGTGSDLAVVTQYKTGALETGTGTEAATLVVEPATRTDAGTGSDAATLAAALSGTEVGTGADLASLVVVLATIADAGTGADVAEVSLLKSVSDDGVGLETASVAVGAVYITGFTRDGSGNRLGSCVVHVFRTSDDVLIAETTSNSLGVYSVEVAPGVQHYVVAYRAGTPDRAGTTVNTLVGS